VARGYPKRGFARAKTPTTPVRKFNFFAAFAPLRGRGELNKCDAAQQGTHLIRMRPGKFTRMNPSPDFIFKQAAGNQILLPKLFGWRSVFRQQMSKGNRSIEID
jgi:hypothetical protein